MLLFLSRSFQLFLAHTTPSNSAQMDKHGWDKVLYKFYN